MTDERPGKGPNIEVARYLYEHLARELKRLVDEGWRSEGRFGVHLGRNGWVKNHILHWKREFCSAAISVVDRRLAAIRREAERGTEGGEVRALVVVSDRELREATARFFPELRKTRLVERTRLGDARRLGSEAGESVSIHAGVGDGERRMAGMLK